MNFSRNSSFSSSSYVVLSSLESIMQQPSQASFATLTARAKSCIDGRTDQAPDAGAFPCLAYKIVQTFGKYF